MIAILRAERCAVWEAVANEAVTATFIGATVGVSTSTATRRIETLHRLVENQWHRSA